MKEVFIDRLRSDGIPGVKRAATAQELVQPNGNAGGANIGELTFPQGEGTLDVYT
jgi:hypothetical protein